MLWPSGEGTGLWIVRLRFRTRLGSDRLWGDKVAQLVERRTRDPNTRGSKPLLGAQEKSVKICPSQKCCADSLSVCPAPVCIRTHKNDHVRTIKILLSMSDFGELRKHEKTHPALVGLGSAVLAADVALPR